MVAWCKWILQRRLCVRCRVYLVGSDLYVVILHAYCYVVLQLQPMDVYGYWSWRSPLNGDSKWQSAWKKIPSWNVMALGNQWCGFFALMMRLHVVLGITCVAFFMNHFVVWSSRMQPSWRSSYAHCPCIIHFVPLWWSSPEVSMVQPALPPQAV